MPNVLITGASRGIGRATAMRLARAGWEVAAGVRRTEDGEALTTEAPGITAIELDITSPQHVAALAERLPDQLDAVVNNAGIVVGGPVEAISLDELRRQLEVNLVAQLAVTQAVMPRLRASRGRVVFVSSLSGRVATPLMGAYNASKFGLEGLADALRMELAPWGIRVILVEPAQTDTDIWRGAFDAFDQQAAALADEHRRLYAKHIAGFRKRIPSSQRMAAPPEAVAAVIEKSLTSRRPRARYVVGVAAKVQLLMAGLSPTPLLDRAVGLASGVPRRP